MKMVIALLADHICNLPLRPTAMACALKTNYGELVSTSSLKPALAKNLLSADFYRHPIIYQIYISLELIFSMKYERCEDNSGKTTQNNFSCGPQKSVADLLFALQ